MYGEDADLSLRAAALGYRPAITPDAVVTHEIGVSSATREDKLLLLFRGKATLLRKHWRGLRLRARARPPPGGHRARALADLDAAPLDAGLAEPLRLARRLPGGRAGAASRRASHGRSARLA